MVIYCVSREGVTGVQNRIDDGAANLVKRIKLKTNLPVAIGFGIGTPEQAAEAALLGDGVVVGSAIVNKFNDEPDTIEGRQRAAKFVKKMVRAVKGYKCQIILQLLWPEVMESVFGH